MASPADLRPYKIFTVEGIDGAGKSTLIETLQRRLSDRALKERLSPQMGTVYREIIDEPTGWLVRYQDVVPSQVRYASYIVDAIMQFRWRQPRYAEFDWLLFDRWLPTYDVYCGDLGRHESWYRKFAEFIPDPDVLCYLRTSPTVALERLVTRGDWTVDNWDRGELLTDLERLSARYDQVMSEVDCVVIDGDGEPEDVARKVLELIGARS
ncbi:dTMP kinase [Microbispora sp. NPDC049125]|uniref:dTMP kinase n=1 Tax=Microbispora sp. NPDC049125 TaxID=3154929 RepID=UPI0034666EB6